MNKSQIRSSSTKRRRILNELAEISAVNSIEYESESLQTPHETSNINDIPVIEESDTLHEGTIIF